MNCDAVTKQLPLMLYGELSFDEEELVQQHLDVCAACRSETGEDASSARAASIRRSWNPIRCCSRTAGATFVSRRAHLPRAAAHTAARGRSLSAACHLTAPPGTGSASR